MITDEQISQVRRFNRLVTQQARALDDHFLGRDRPLGESRVLYEIGEQGADLRDVRARLGLDSGYLSRLVQSLAAKGLVELRPGPARTPTTGSRSTWPDRAVAAPTAMTTFPSAIGPLDLATVADGYIREWRRFLANQSDQGWDSRDPDTAAYEALEQAIRDGPAGDAWEGVMELLRRWPDDDLDSFSAGPLENLVVERGVELIERIEAEAERDERFRWALAGIWLSRGELPDDVLERVVRASGGKIEPFPPLDELRLP
jgi:hypothetical protein